MANAPTYDEFQRIERRLKAFVCLASPDSSSSAGTVKAGPLSGARLGVKDLLDVAGLPTGCGALLNAGRPAQSTADVVRRAESAGATVIGKTVTTEFATFVPGPTTNPQNEHYTPGGSSSGSAAGVGAGLLTHALGTQTAGSVIRPAAFCGIVGVLPSMGLVSRHGLKVVAPSLDRIGAFGRDLAAASALADVIADIPPPSRTVEAPFRVGFFSDDVWADADMETRGTLQAFRAILARGPHEIVPLDEGERVHALMQAQTDIMQYEVARSLSDDVAQHPDLISDSLKQYCAGGAAISEARYDEALKTAADGRQWAAGLFDCIDVVASPSASSLPPKTLASTGDPYVSRAWSALYLPCVTLPTRALRDNLKGAVQLVGAFNQDRTLLSISKEFEPAIASIGPEDIGI